MPEMRSTAKNGVGNGHGPVDLLLEKPLPFATDAEKAILGAVILDNTVYAEVAGIPADRFYSLSNRHAYRAMQALMSRSLPVDPIALRDEMRRAGTLDESGGEVFIASLWADATRFSNIENYVRILNETATEREMIHAGAAITSMAMDESVPIPEKIHRAKQIIDGIEDPNAKIQWRNVSEIACERIAAAEDFAASERTYSGLSTGLLSMDCVMDGLQKTDLIVIGARPAMGKSSLTSVIAEGVADSPLNDNPLIAIFSLEMGEKQYTDRMVSSRARVDMRRMKRGQLSEAEWKRVVDAQRWFNTRRIFIDGESVITPTQMRAKLRALKRQEGRIDLVICDYLQAIRPETPTGHLTQDVTQVSKTLKPIAKDFDVPFIAVSSMNRANENRGEKRPAMSDLRESGQIESDADVIMLLHREDYYNPETEKQNIAEINFAKHRNGPTCVVELVYLKTISRFEDKYQQDNEQ